jgi:uncharacterized protein (DUF4415 family)
MFGLLKSKLSNFIKGLSGKEEGKGTAQAAADAPEEAKPIPPEPQLENSKQIQKEPRPEEKTIAPPPTASPIFQEEEKQEKILPQPLPEAKQEHKAPAAARFEGEHKEIKREKSDGQIKKAAEDETQSDGPQAGVEKNPSPAPPKRNPQGRKKIAVRLGGKRFFQERGDGWQKKGRAGGGKAIRGKRNPARAKPSKKGAGRSSTSANQPEGWGKRNPAHQSHFQKRSTLRPICLKKRAKRNPGSSFPEKGAIGNPAAAFFPEKGNPHSARSRHANNGREGPFAA